MRHDGLFKRYNGPAAFLAVFLLPICVLFSLSLSLQGCKSSTSLPDERAKARQEELDRENRWAALFQGDPEGYEVFRSIQGDFQNSQFDAAVNKLQGLLQRQPQPPWAEPVEFRLGQALWMKGQLVEALSQLDRFVASYPDSPDAPAALLTMGEICVRVGSLKSDSGEGGSMGRLYTDKGLQIFQEIPKRYPRKRDICAQALFLAGMTFETMRDSARAGEAFRRVASEFADTSYAPKALYSMAGLSLGEGDTGGAEKFLAEIEKKYPKSGLAERAQSGLEEIRLVGKKASPLRVKEWIGDVPPGGNAMEGKPTLLSFWAIWCPHCRNNVPKMDRMVEKYSSRGLNVLGVSREAKDNDAGKIREYIKAHPMLFPTAVDDEGRTSEAYSVTGVPRVVLVDAQGKIYWFGHPDRLSDKVIEGLLAESPGAKGAS